MANFLWQFWQQEIFKNEKNDIDNQKGKYYSADIVIIMEPTLPWWKMCTDLDKQNKLP